MITQKSESTMYSGQQFAQAVINSCNLKKQENCELIIERNCKNLSRTSLFPSDELLSRIFNELVEKYNNCEKYLDQKFKFEISSGDPKKFLSCLWEIIILDKLRNDTRITSIVHEDKGPDWAIVINKNNYYIEATCAQLPEINKDNKSEIHRARNEFGNNKFLVTSYNKLIDECKARISGAVSAKIKKHKDFMSKKNAGYILCISYSSLPFYATCDLYKAVETILAIGPLGVRIDTNSNSMCNEHLSDQNNFTKPTTGAQIPTSIFDNKDNSWISAILFSKAEPCLLLPTYQLINENEIKWNGIANDFVLIHNPKAKHPLGEDEDIFGSKTRISKSDNKLKICGENIFPTLQKNKDLLEV